MPVPFPEAGAVKLGPPDATETRVIAGGVAAAVEPDGGLTSLQRLLIEAMIESMTGFVVPARHVPRLSAPEFALALARRNEEFRQRMLQFMLVNALVLTPLPETVMTRIDEYAYELGVDNDMLRVAHRYAQGSLGLALIDFERSGYMQAWDPAHADALHTSQALSDAWEQCVFDPTLADRWEALRGLPDGTLGRAVVRFYDARGFTFPGRPGSAPPLLAQHDWVHVLADYGTTVESEVEVFGFIARANDDMHAFSLLAMVISLFETGYLRSGAGLFESSPGHLTAHPKLAVRLSDALRRGALCHDSVTGSDSVDFLRLDWFELAAVPIEDARARFCLQPKSPEALDAGAVGPWEAGGISPFQVNAGRDLAARLGRTYDPLGAAP